VDSSRIECLETLNKALFPPESPKLRVSPSFMKTLMRDAIGSTAVSGLDST
jgi:hypothetical protein